MTESQRTVALHDNIDGLNFIAPGDPPPALRQLLLITKQLYETDVYKNCYHNWGIKKSPTEFNIFLHFIIRMLRSRSQGSVCEQEAKFVQDRITGVEKHFAELCTSFAAFTRKAARLRDKNDEVAKVIQTYAESETINRSLSSGLTNFSTTLSVIGDYRDAEVRRLDSKIIAPLSQYSTVCKHAREEVKNTFTARERELVKRRQLEKVRERNPRNRQVISQAESELMKATVEVSRVVKGLEEQIDSFEKQKLYDVKHLLLDFVNIELSFHTKTVELLTKAYRDIAEIDEAKDLEEFREVLNIPDTMARLDTVRRTSFRQSHSLGNIANRLASSPLNLKKLTSRPAQSIDSLKAGSSDSVHVEEYGDSSEEEESEESMEQRPVLPKTVIPKSPRKFVLRLFPPMARG
ncbi:CBY1-interacting BAR domain-containing protein 1-A isoform X2 [Diachasmimorpha longicaudata]|uniref:CBY1-interacting BAR domain-containing protein 1-A isoform X2 n=1 Tax=Diachasmimorpha longicaudata TaxID=58733 RepID=UPI0030B9158E